MRLRVLAGSIAVVCALAACGGGGEENGGDSSESFGRPLAGAEAYPVFASPELVVGRNRLLVGLLNQDDAPIGSENIDVHMRFFDLTRSTEKPLTEATMRFVPIDRFRGIYVSSVRFQAAGKWGAEATIQGDGYDEVVRTELPPVLEEPTTPDIGARVPA